jgi:HEAT repeat protein
MNRKQLILAGCFIFFCMDLTLGFAQTSSSSSGSKSRGGSLRTSFRDNDKDNDTSRRGQTRDFIISLIGSMLRHPDKKIRLQALQSISGALGQASTTTSSSSSNTDEGIGGIFRIGNTDTDKDNKNSRSSGFGGTTVIPDLYTLLADPEPEIRELASVAIDQTFGSEVSLFNYLSDPDPLIRKYAVKVIAAKKMRDREGGDSSVRGSASSNILVLRILLNMLKDPDASVKEAATETLDTYLGMLGLGKFVPGAAEGMGFDQGMPR